MESSNTIIKLSPNRMKEIDVNNYEKDFIFYVNGEAYPVCRLFADLIAPKISQLHFSDPTSKEYYITTKHSGNFQHIINLINYEDKSINDEEIPFIIEILSILDNRYIQIQMPEQEISITNSLDILNKYEQYGSSYISQYDTCISFISENFDKIIKQSQDKFLNLSQISIEKVISKDKLRLESEDQLLNLINILYEKDFSNSYLYKYVNFENVSTSSICEFLNIFNYNDLDHEIWTKFSILIRQGNHSSFLKNCNEIKGIFNFLQNQKKLKNEIILTTSQIYSPNCQSAENIFLFDNDREYFQTVNDKNAFIRFEFKSKLFVPTGYRIKTTSSNSYTPRNWVIEASNDKEKWDVIDIQSNTKLKDINNWWNFSVKNQNLNKYKYLQMRQIGENSHSSYNLTINSIDFDGYLINK